MASEEMSCYEGASVQSFQFYLDHSGEHEAMLKCLRDLLPAEFKRISADKQGLDVLGLGSGGGEMDVQILGLLKAACPDLPITVDVVEGSSKLTEGFKALVAKSPDIQGVPFTWHIMHSDSYINQVKAKVDAKKFDFIHSIQMIYYVDALTETIEFYHGLLKKKGTFMIIVEAHDSGWDRLWSTYSGVLCDEVIKEYRSSKQVIASLNSLGLKFEEHAIPNCFDVTECADPGSTKGRRLLNFLTARDDFHQSFTPEIRAEILDFLKNKCSTEKDGRVMFDATLSCLLVRA
ncbi:histamine N-methyltransferase A-like [Takifugu flavidus]|uniref:Histamine N-methyltransferase A n=1 Tax=Takifugu flavidus TaxID=433684 RepID=A0A5C6PPB8_9TELE|nr:histamine N-methyltransferase A-like [Takifugu flavidus]TWW80588.1 Histamine N-methyltransferase A [Takifugu flavidus]